MKKLKTILNEIILVNQHNINMLIFESVRNNFKSINEALKIAKSIEDVLKKYKLKIPNDITDLDSVEASSNNKNLSVQYRNKKQEIKIGKVLGMMFPNLLRPENQKILNKIIDDINITASEKSEFNYKYEIKNSNISKWYNTCKAKSCMVGKSNLTDFYDKIKDVNILIAFDANNMPYGRALLWKNVKGNSKKIYMDRIYPANDVNFINETKRYAESHGWNYRDKQGYSDYNSIKYGSKLEYQIEDSVWKQIKIMPYMDTFRYGDKDGNLTNYATSVSDYTFGDISGTEIINNMGILDYIDEKYYTQNKDGSYDVKGNVDISDISLNNINVKFNKINGYFECSYNRLTSLEGSPKQVGGGFYCRYNKLTSLEGSPKQVGGNFYCKGNKLTSLKGAPESIGEDFNCSNNRLTSLEGAPKIVKGNFDCSNNQLTSLKRAPKQVDGDFDCKDNLKKLTEEDVRKVCDVKGRIIV